MSRGTVLFAVVMVKNLWVLLSVCVALLTAALPTCDVVIHETTEAGAHLEAALAQCHSPTLWVICFGEGVFTGFAPNGTVLATPTGANLTITFHDAKSTNYPTLDFEGGQGFIINSGFTSLSHLNFENGISQGDGGCLNVVGGGFEAVTVAFANCSSKAGNGGAIAVSTNAAWEMTYVIIQSSSALQGQGGAIFVEIPTKYPGYISLSVVCWNNVAASGGCAALLGNPSTQARYVIVLTASNNTAVSGNGGGLLVNVPPASGNSSKNVFLFLNSNSYDSNSAAGSGGAMALFNVGASITTACNVNTAGGMGGAMYLSSSNVYAAVDFAYNFAVSGGGIYAEGDDDGILQLVSSGIMSNKAIGGSGGGVFVSGVSFSISGSYADGNLASEDGGCLYLEGTPSPVSLSDTWMNGNNASGYGGSVCLSGGAGAVFSAVYISSSQASSGGGIAILDARAVLFNDSFVELSKEGSGIFVMGFTSALTVSYSMVSGNTGAGLTCAAGSIVDISSTTTLLCSNSGPADLSCDGSCTGCSTYSPPGGSTTCGGQCSAVPTLCIPNRSLLSFPPCEYCNGNSKPSQ